MATCYDKFKLYVNWRKTISSQGQGRKGVFTITLYMYKKSILIGKHPEEDSSYTH